MRKLRPRGGSELSSATPGRWQARENTSNAFQISSFYITIDYLRQANFIRTEFYLAQFRRLKDIVLASAGFW